ncbi:agamous-like MADS-box protein MADS9 [Cornus florida]|uniref:agamous-like MADS-box protein MADS9 n=1 Tax=Cornus florida TaxID=4283 RepID=UPI00289AA1BB|nr:agamous-like MADS-box protein MADS9 [Cornus florida]
MGRGKIKIKRIQNSSNRQVKKKAKEITVSLVIFDSSGKMHEYCSPGTKLGDILDRYHTESGKRLWDAKHENLSNEIDRIKKENDSMQIELRHLKGDDITSLPYKELKAIEEALENGLMSNWEKQVEIVRMRNKNEIMLEEETEEYKLLAYQLSSNVNSV